MRSEEGEGNKKLKSAINIHTALSILVMQAVALARAKAGQMGELRVCVRKVA